MIRIVRLGSPRATGEGPRIGTARRPPRGVKKGDYAKLDYYDAWLPDLAPSQKLVSWALSQPWTGKRWKKFERDYRREMKAPAADRLLALLALLSRHANFSVGCYCEDESRCHRSILKELLVEKNGVCP
jgi:uncharacterized protein YeaO (DUF488 family)